MLLRSAAYEMDDGGYGLYLKYAWAATSTLVQVVLATLGYIIYYIAFAIWFVLRQLVRPVVFLLQPLVYLGRFILAVLAAPFRLIVKLEVMHRYYPLGIAILTCYIDNLHLSWSRCSCWLDYRCNLEVHSRLNCYSPAARRVWLWTREAAALCEGVPRC